MEKISESRNRYLSSDLSGFEKYLEGEGYSVRHTGFLKLAPRRLFEVFGSYGSLQLMGKKEYRRIFLSHIKDQYKEGTLKKYRSGITQYRNYLVNEGILSPNSYKKVCRKNSDPVRLLYLLNRNSNFANVEKKYADYLDYEVNCCPSERRKRLVAYERLGAFLIEHDHGCFSELNAMSLIDFCNRKTTTKTDLRQLPRFLKFAYREGHTPEDLSKIIIRHKAKIRKKRRYLPSNNIERILSAVCRKDEFGKRSYAMFILMARLGLRPIELTRIKLRDIQWTRSRIQIRGKLGKKIWMPLLECVAEAIIDYLKQSRRGSSEYLFVKTRPPHDGILNTCFLHKHLRRLYEETGISPPTGNVRLNVFRHSFATARLNAPGNTLVQVQGLMRHESDGMTAHYAKYHTNTLEVFEHDWPEQDDE